MKNILSIVLVIIISCFYTDIYAKSINDRVNLKPKSRLKINKQLAKAYLPIRKHYRKTDSKVLIQRGASRRSNGDSSGSIQTINSFNNVRYAPREVITSVKGDIVNICFHCR
ncbi:MAG: hypothetical protein KAU26_06875 [Methylococcales bacterium]|nr:hypothetical protein [Methylococcales bacterium]